MRDGHFAPLLICKQQVLFISFHFISLVDAPALEKVIRKMSEYLKDVDNVFGRGNPEYLSVNTPKQHRSSDQIVQNTMRGRQQEKQDSHNLAKHTFTFADPQQQQQQQNPNPGKPVQSAENF